MADDKKYYYLKLKDNFFDSEEIKILEAMPNGYKYSNLLLKLYLKSLKFNGALRLNEYIPYNIEMISTISNIDIDTVKVAMDIFKQLKLIEVLEDGTIYMLEIQNYIGKSSTEADRIRDYRVKITNEKQKLLNPSTNDVQMYDVHTPEIEKELDIDKDIEIDKKKKPDKKHYADNVTLTEEEYNKLIAEYGKSLITDKIEDLDLWKGSKGKKTKSDYMTIRQWIKRDSKGGTANGQYTGNNQQNKGKYSGIKVPECKITDADREAARKLEESGELI